MAPVPLSHLTLGPHPLRLRLPEEQILSAGGEGGEDLTVPQIPATGRPGDAAREGMVGVWWGGAGTEMRAGEEGALEEMLDWGAAPAEVEERAALGGERCGSVHTAVAGRLCVSSSNRPTAPGSTSHPDLILSLQPPSPSREPCCSLQSDPCSLEILTPRPILGQSG